MADKERKIQILKAAVKRFAKHGLNKTTLDEIARDLRIGKATIYHYFNSKEELFYETIKWEASQFIEEVNLIFKNEEQTLNEKFLNYITYKENTAQKYRLIYELFLLLLKDESFERESAILKDLLKNEEEILKEVLSLHYKNKKEEMNTTLPSFLVMQSWGIFFSGKLFNISDPQNPSTTQDLFMKGLGNILE